MGDKIIKLCDDTYFVAGKVIQGFDTGTFDGVTPGDMIPFVQASLGTDACPADYGELTVYVLSRLRNDPDGAEYGLSGMEHFSSLPERAKEILRKEFPDHAGEF